MIVNLHSVRSGVAVVVLPRVFLEAQMVELAKLVTTLLQGGLSRIIVDGAAVRASSTTACAGLESMIQECRQAGGDLRLYSATHELILSLQYFPWFDELVLCSSKEAALLTFSVPPANV